MQLSVSGQQSAPSAGPGSSASAFADPSFASSLLSSADLNDPLVQAALAQMQQQQQGGSGSGSGGGEGDAKSDEGEAGKKRKGDDM